MSRRFTHLTDKRRSLTFISNTGECHKVDSIINQRYLKRRIPSESFTFIPFQEVWKDGRNELRGK